MWKQADVMPFLDVFKQDVLPLKFDLSGALQGSNGDMKQKIGSATHGVLEREIQSEVVPINMLSDVQETESVNTTRPKQELTEDAGAQLMQGCCELRSEHDEDSSVIGRRVGRRIVRAASRNILARQFSDVECGLISETSSITVGLFLLDIFNDVNLNNYRPS
jgi:hypothetical protein